jgi:hypothetical protein
VPNESIVSGMISNHSTATAGAGPLRLVPGDRLDRAEEALKGVGAIRSISPNGRGSPRLGVEVATDRDAPGLRRGGGAAWAPRPCNAQRLPHRAPGVGPSSRPVPFMMTQRQQASPA